MLETASNRGVNLGAVSKNVFEKKKKITASFDSTYSANIIFASEDKQVHSSNINNESNFVKFTLNFFSERVIYLCIFCSYKLKKSK